MLSPRSISLLLVTTVVASLLLIVSAAKGQDVSQEGRVFENQIPKHLPIQVRIRAAKEKAAGDLSNERWHRDLEIEVKNTGDKPIYYLSIVLEMPDVRVNGDPVAFIVRYGERSLLDDSKGTAQPEDIPFKPRDTIVLSLGDGPAGGWEIAKTRDNWLQPKKVVIEFEQLNFGDGTGFFTGAGVAWPLPKCSELSTKGIPCRGRP